MIIWSLPFFLLLLLCDTCIDFWFVIWCLDIKSNFFTMTVCYLEIMWLCLWPTFGRIERSTSFNTCDSLRWYSWSGRYLRHSFSFIETYSRYERTKGFSSLAFYALYLSQNNLQRDKKGCNFQIKLQFCARWKGIREWNIIKQKI